MRPTYRANAARFLMDDRAGYAPLDRNRKARLLHTVEAFERATKRRGGRNGNVTLVGVAVLKALLFGFHNSQNGRCNPSYTAIMKRTGLCRASVAKGIKILEALNIIAVTRSLARLWHSSGRVVVQQACNRYAFRELPRLIPVELPPIFRQTPRVYGANRNPQPIDIEPLSWMQRPSEVRFSGDWRERTRALFTKT